MRNHYHLAVETPEANPVAGMQWLQATFAARFNRFRNERGHLFQGRYKALLVEEGDWLGNVATTFISIPCAPARCLEFLRLPPGNRLEALTGGRTGQHSIRINDQWRICFVWTGSHAERVEIVDYH